MDKEYRRTTVGEWDLVTAIGTDGKYYSVLHNIKTGMILKDKGKDDPAQIEEMHTSFYDMHITTETLTYNSNDRDN